MKALSPRRPVRTVDRTDMIARLTDLHTRKRLPAQLPLNRETHLPSTPARLRPHLPRALHADLALAQRAAFQLPVRAFLSLRERI